MVSTFVQTTLKDRCSNCSFHTDYYCCILTKTCEGATTELTIKLVEWLEPQLKYWKEDGHEGYIIPMEVWNKLKGG